MEEKGHDGVRKEARDHGPRRGGTGQSVDRLGPDAAHIFTTLLRLPPKIKPMLDGINTVGDFGVFEGAEAKGQNRGGTVLAASNRHAATHVPSKREHRGRGQPHRLVPIAGSGNGARLNQRSGLPGFSYQPFGFTQPGFDDLQPTLVGGGVSFYSSNKVNS